MQLTDTHCHPQFEALSVDPDKIISDASKANVSRLLAVGTTIEDSQAAIAFAQKYPNVWAAAGVHPHAAAQYLVYDDWLLELRALLKQSKVVAVGEIGLDLYKSYSTIKEQEVALRGQIEEGLDSDLPFIFHVRDAWRQFWYILDSYPEVKGVVHSFSAGQKQLDKILEKGLHVGLNGIMTFTKDQAQLAAAKNVPSSRLLLETDAPFLAPKPFRGQTCEPKHIRTIAEFLAALRGEPLEDLAASTTANAIKLFHLN